jgi:four helix bundle protein
MKDFRTLQVWQKSHDLTVGVYQETCSFPKEEMFGVTSQLRRAASSIPANIAEGCGRGSDKDFARFVQIAFGSASEVEYFFLLCRDLNYIEENTFQNYINSIIEIKKMLSSFLKSLKK